MSRTSLRTLAIFVLLLLAAALPISAQVDKAVLEITVVDQSDAAIPGATVTVSRPETGYSAMEVTGSSGAVRFPALIPASYEVKVELSGFSTIQQKGVVLRVGQTQKIAFTMRAEASEAITVTAGAGLVDVYKQDASTNIIPEQIESLPVPDRDFQRLAFIAPGVQRERGSFRFIGGGPVIGGGGNASQATILVDGVDFTDPALGLARTRFSQDSIQEFRVMTNRFDPEIGGSAGGALSIITKSGTNDLHGTAFGFYRDDALRAKGELEQKNLPYSRGQYGFTVGGPIVRDQLMFFGSFEYVNEENIALFRPGGGFVSQADDVKHPFNQTLAYIGLNQQLGSSQLLAGKVVYESYDEKNFRVGGLADVSYGQELKRDNKNLSLEHNWVISPTVLNELRFQVGSRRYDEPPNSNKVAEWFSSGATLMTGTNILGHLLGDGNQWELRDVYHFSLGANHSFRSGLSVQRVSERSRIDTYETGLFLWATDTRALPVAYAYGIGSSDVKTDTTRYGAFVSDEWKPTTRLNVNLGVRYDLDTNGNNPDFKHPLVGDRKVDRNNIQPRFGFSWDTTGHGNYVVRGGVGLFTGRYLLVPLFTELQQNGITGRRLQTRVNGIFYGLPQFALDPNNPTTTGIPLKTDITLLQDSLRAPESRQASLGLTTRITPSIFLDTEAVYSKGKNEIIVRDVNFGGNSNPVRLNSAWNQINMYTNQGHSEYKAFIASLNGTLRGGHLLTANVTVADKKNIMDDFSPDFPFGYPNDPSNIEAEYGRARSFERYHVVLTGVFKMPWSTTVAPIYEYGSGQPWTSRLGYDYNGDGKNSDRAPGVKRDGKDGPKFNQLSLRLTKAIPVGTFGRLEAIAEAFNVLNQTNYDVNSVDAAQYLGGPTILSPGTAYRPNPNYGKFRATLPSREIQLGLRWAF